MLNERLTHGNLQRHNKTEKERRTEILRGEEEIVKMILAVGDKRHNNVDYFDLNVKGWERAGEYKFTKGETTYNKGFWDAQVIFIRGQFFVFGGVIGHKTPKDSNQIGRLDMNLMSYYNKDFVKKAEHGTEIGKRGKWVEAGYQYNFYFII